MAGNRAASHSSEAPARDNLTRRLTPRRSKMHGVMQASTLTARTVRTRTFAASSLGKELHPRFEGCSKWKHPSATDGFRKRVDGETRERRRGFTGARCPRVETTRGSRRVWSSRRCARHPSTRAFATRRSKRRD